jgi:hypothetical protein
MFLFTDSVGLKNHAYTSLFLLRPPFHPQPRTGGPIACRYLMLGIRQADHGQNPAFEREAGITMRREGAPGSVHLPLSYCLHVSIALALSVPVVWAPDKVSGVGPVQRPANA